MGERPDLPPTPQGKWGTSAACHHPGQDHQGLFHSAGVTYRELRRKLERLGCVYVRQGHGSHEIWSNPANARQTTIPRHGNRDLATGTLHEIRRDLGIPRQDFDRA